MTESVQVEPLIEAYKERKTKNILTQEAGERRNLQYYDHTTTEQKIDRKMWRSCSHWRLQ
jgi:hypothetical protein